MAYAEVTSLMQTLQRLMQLHPCPIQKKRKKKIESLLQKVSFLQGFFDDSGKDQCNDHEDIEYLEGIIRDVSCKAEDLVEEIMFDYSSSSGIKKIATKFLDTNLYRKIKSIEVAITRVYDDISSIKVRPTTSSSCYGGSHDLTPPLSSQKDVVVGLDDDFLRIADKLTGYPSKLDVVAIFGMGGIGKTTLAKRVYHDKLIEYHFYIRAWITISQRYSVRNLLLGLLNCTSRVPFRMDELGNEELAEQLYKSLKGRRYLIVMDDIWDTKTWNDVRRYFPNDNNGSRIMVTSRIMEVADFISPYNRPHQMRFLTADESWTLLQEKVLGLESCSDYEMERIGMQIAQKCKGLPLAIVMAAGILSKVSATPTRWSAVAGSFHSSFITQESRECLDVLALSYNHLPHHLKACFLYMGAFPEDVEIPVWRLVRLWAAEGFIKLESPKTLEWVAQEYLQDLIDRSLILVGKRSYDRVKTCSIHDVLRKFCLEEAQREKHLHVVRSFEPQFSQGAHRRLHFHSDIFAYSSYTYSNPYLRSFLSSKGCSVLEGSYFGRMGFKLLRVLDVGSYYFYHFPILVIKLVHLRYLALSINSELPRSISKLENLQTLIISWGSKKTRTLPFEIWKMPILRHIHVKGDVLLFEPIANHSKKNVQVLGNLQTLCTITISSINFSHGLVATVPNLMTLATNLVTNGNYADWLGDCLNNLVHLYSLETLKLLFNLPMENPRLYNSIQRWDAFPPNLKKLTLSCSLLPWEDAKVLGKLPNLEVLKLKHLSFQGPEWETNEEGFHQLNYLLVESRELVLWKQASTGGYPFPALRHLVLRFCYKLKEIPYEIGDIPSLEVIELHSCSPYAARLATTIQEEQINSGNSCLEIFIHPS
ncbi:putative late blight resistance protein homolog R1B-17 [Lycium barbarum]|uniref:putative late blight resistance protein homolog R1B-17 n=1 Tax=Lycium barbarum TaxID=112863 RepID=UPI00293F3C97|nr:putative late blight resistance protein homolog R1B-17 [Lycium barbarum]